MNVDRGSAGEDDNGLDTRFLGGDPGSLLTNLQDELHGDEHNAPASRNAPSKDRRFPPNIFRGRRAPQIGAPTSDPMPAIEYAIPTRTPRSEISGVRYDIIGAVIAKEIPAK